MEFRRPRSLDEALAELASFGDGGVPLAGGTDVMVQYQARDLAPAALIDIGQVDELLSRSMGANTSIGSRVTHRDLATDPAIATRHPALASAAAKVGGWQTQAVGTLGGNICNASPAADTIAPLLLADAELTLASQSGHRRIGLAEFLLDRRSTQRRPDELLTAVELTPLPPGAREVYLKLGRRSAMDLAIVGVAVRLGVAENGVVESARVALCSVAPTARRVPAAEAVLVGSRLEADAVSEAGARALDASSPIDDQRASAAYRRRVLPGLVERAIDHCRSGPLTSEGVDR